MEKKQAPKKARRSSTATAGPRLSDSSRQRQQPALHYEADYDDYPPLSTGGSMRSGGGGGGGGSGSIPNKKKQPSKSGGSMSGSGGMQQLQQQQMQMLQHMQQQQIHQQRNGDIQQMQLRFCKEVIKELFKKEHQAFTYPFYDPVGKPPKFCR